MEALLLVLCNFPNVPSARQIGTLLVERQLAACLNLMPKPLIAWLMSGTVLGDPRPFRDELLDRNFPFF